MAQSKVNPIQNISYTNLDFSSIYEETLDLIKQLTYKWDPSISNESDPGVILLKLSALLADKSNYNIDKSVLETFPISVTQEGNARKLYEQLGYYMRWYESASVPVTFSWIGPKDANNITTYTIPKFSVITDSENKVNYAVVGTESNKGIVVSDGKLSTDGNAIKLTAMEGTPTQFSFLGEHVITPQMVDNDNRLYFTTQYVSQNGVFIKNTGQENYASWKRVDNLYEQTFNELRYKFGYDSKANLAYIEFPDNYEQLIGSGIEIVYLIINPNYSEVPAQSLDRFLVPITPKESTEVSLSFDTVKVMNLTSSIGHREKETINEAYDNYQKVVGTFKTLITLRDYLNYITNNANSLCSNAFVTDRTNDPQSTYKIIGKEKGIDTYTTEVEQLPTGEFELAKTTDKESTLGKSYYKLGNTGVMTSTPFSATSGDVYYEMHPLTKDALTPFSLKLYFMQKGVSLNSRTSYNESFSLTNDLPLVNNMIEGTKHLEHTYEDILPLGENTYKLTEDTTNNFNKSYYTFNPKTKEYTLATSQYYQQTADSSFDKNKSYYLKVGDTFKQVDSNPQLIGMCDAPVKTKDETWVTDKEYYLLSNGGLLKGLTRQMPVSGKTPKELELYEKPTATIKTEWAPTEILYIEGTPGKYIGIKPIPSIFPLYEQVSIAYGNPKKMGLYELDVEALLYHVIMYKAKYPISMSISTYTNVGTDTQSDILTNIINAFYKYTRAEEMKFGEPISIDYLTEIVKASDTRIKNVAFDSINYSIEAVHYDKNKKEFITTKLPKNLSSITPKDLTDEEQVRGYYFAKELVAKSILAGTSQLLVPDTQFKYHINQHFKNYVDSVGIISGEATLSLADQQTAFVGIDEVRKTYTLQENEVLTLFRPALNSVKSFGSGIHYEYLLYNDIIEGQVHELKQGELIVFYNPTVNDSGNIVGYTVSCYKEGAIIQPTIKLDKQPETKSLSNYVLQSVLLALSEQQESAYETIITNPYWVSEIRSSSAIINNVISGSATIAIKKLNKVTINSQDGYKFYWVLDRTTYSNEDNLKSYVLFNEYNPDVDTNRGSQLNTYTLKNGEYLYYTNADNTELVILGAGTSITRNCGLDSKAIEITEVPYEFIDIANTNYEFEFVKQVHDGNLTINPQASGLYEDSSGTKVRTLDTHRQSGKTYYVLCMKSVAGQYVQTVSYTKEGKKTESFTPTSDITNSVFTQYDTKYSMKDLNPKSQGLFEVISDSNIPFIDKYQMQGNTYKGTYRRFAHTLDTSIITQKIFKGVYSDIDINNINTYKSINITEDQSNSISPTALELLQPADNTTKEFNTYYEKNEQGNYTQVTTTENQIPCAKNKLYRKSQNTYEITTDVFSWKPSDFTYANTTTPFEVVQNIAMSTDITNCGYYYKSALTDTTFIYDRAHTNAGLQASAYTLTAFITLYNQVASRDNTTATLLPRLNTAWQTSITHATPGNWYLTVFNEHTEEPQWISGNTTKTYGDNIYVLLPEALLNSSSVTRGLKLSSQIYPSTVFDIDNSLLKGILVRIDEIKRYMPTEGGARYNLYEIDNTYRKIENSTSPSRSYEIISNLYTTLTLLSVSLNSSSLLDKFVVYYMPIYYRFKQLYKRTDKVYYRLNTYYKKSFPKVSSWSCSALDLNDISAEPLTALRKSWQTVQTNTSITITENSFVSLAEGDKFMVTASSAYDFNVNWPTFNNNEITLDLKAYNCVYKKQGQEEIALNKLTIPSCDWKGYSSLLINTSGTNGQYLKDNQTLTLYDDTPKHNVLATISDTYFQLAHPVQNRTGTYLEVHTYDILGNRLLNTLYAYTLELDTETLKYNADNNLYVTSNSSERIPFNLPAGKYLLTVSPTEKSSVSLQYKVATKVGDEIYSLATKPLTNYVNGESVLQGEKYRYVNVDVPVFIEINNPTEALAKMQKSSPKDVGNWYKDTTSNDITSDTSVSGTYYVKVRDYDACVEISVTTTTGQPETIMIGDIFKYENNVLLGNEFERIKNKMQRLDKSEKYNYTHIPKDSDLIADPLVPKSFWSHNHIANKFTIAQMDFDKEESIEYKFIN